MDKRLVFRHLLDVSVSSNGQGSSRVCSNHTCGKAKADRGSRFLVQGGPRLTLSSHLLLQSCWGGGLQLRPERLPKITCNEEPAVRRADPLCLAWQHPFICGIRAALQHCQRLRKCMRTRVLKYPLCCMCQFQGHCCYFRMKSRAQAHLPPGGSPPPPPLLRPLPPPTPQPHTRQLLHQSHPLYGEGQKKLTFVGLQLSRGQTFRAASHTLAPADFKSGDHTNVPIRQVTPALPPMPHFVTSQDPVTHH
jgi:hypothetical protein